METFKKFLVRLLFDVGCFIAGGILGTFVWGYFGFLMLFGIILWVYAYYGIRVNREFEEKAKRK